MKLVIDGPIGCGKSSLIKEIVKSKCIDIPLYNEPVYDWDQWLKLFYSDMKRYAFSFQMRVLKSHLEHKDIQNGIFERSPLSCNNVFGRILYEDNFMSDLEWSLANSYYCDYGWNPDIVIYLKLSPEKCLERIKQRNRDGEQGITLEYLKQLHDKYEEIYKSNSSMKVITIDATKSIEEIFAEVKERILNRIRFSSTRVNDFSFT